MKFVEKFRLEEKVNVARLSSNQRLYAKALLKLVIYRIYHTLTEYPRREICEVSSEATAAHARGSVHLGKRT